MDWDKLKTFYIVATQGSLSAAEAILNTSQSALSRQISQLEYTLRTKLFERHSRGLTLSEAGTHLLRRVTVIYKDLAQAEIEMLEQRSQAAGLLKVILPSAFSSFWLTPLLREFRDLYPKISLSIVSDEAASLNYSLKEGVYVQLSSFTPQGMGDLTTERLCSYACYPFASQEYLNARGTPRSTADLKYHELIAFNAEASHIIVKDKELNPLLYAQTGTRREADIVVDSAHNALIAAAHHQGIAVLPLYIARSIPGLAQLHLEDYNPYQNGPVEKFLLYPSYLKNFERIRVFRDFIIAKARLIDEIPASTQHRVRTEKKRFTSQTALGDFLVVS